MKNLRRAVWLAGLSTAASLLLVSLLPGMGRTQDGRKITILSTASVNGEISPCG